MTLTWGVPWLRVSPKGHPDCLVVIRKVCEDPPPTPKERESHLSVLFGGERERGKEGAVGKREKLVSGIFSPLTLDDSSKLGLIFIPLSLGRKPRLTVVGFPAQVHVSKT